MLYCLSDYLQITFASGSISGVEILHNCSRPYAGLFSFTRELRVVEYPHNADAECRTPVT